MLKRCGFVKRPVIAMASMKAARMARSLPMEGPPPLPPPLPPPSPSKPVAGAYVRPDPILVVPDPQNRYLLNTEILVFLLPNC